MGISGLLPLLKSIQKPCNLKKFSGQTIGVDAYGWLHRGTVACAIDLALEKPTTKFIEFCMSRVRMLIHFGITPYLVFDGANLPSKANTEKDRRERRKESKKAGLELFRLGKTSQAHQELQKAVDVTPEMARMLIEELKRAGVSYVVAPYEADSQLAYLERQGIIDGILSEDSDLLVFGARCLITKLDQYGDCVMIRRDDFTACREISLVGWSDADFRRMAILSGCDYLPNISKMGLKTAYRLLRKHKTVDRIVRAIQFDGQFKVPPTYIEDFTQAENTFLYQWVFCPDTNQLVNLTTPAVDVVISEMTYIGKHVPSDIAAGVARGDLHPNTKQPLGAPKSKFAPRKSLGTPRMTTMATPELKKVKSIDSFFRPRRTPLAEMDPNLFTPSPTASVLLNRTSAYINSTPASTTSSPAPRSYLHRAGTAPSSTLRTSIPSGTATPTRRTVSDTSRNNSASHPSKRQRLCATTPETPSVGSVRVEEGSSRFFQSKDASGPATQTRRKSKKFDFTMYSDDSVEDVLAELADASTTVPESKKKMFVLVDEDKVKTAEPVEEDDQDQDTSQSTIITQSTQDDSQVFSDIGTLNTSFSSSPATSFVENAPKSGSIFGTFLSKNVKQLHEKYSFRGLSTLSSSEIFRPKAIASKASRTRSAPLFTFMNNAQNGKYGTPSRSTAERKAALPGVDSVPGTASVSDSAKEVSEREDIEQAARGGEEAADDAPEIEDSAWQESLTDIVVPGSSPARMANAGDISPEPVLFHIPGSPVKGSEDLLIPDSEDEDDTKGSITPKLDLGRFVFAGAT